MTDEEYCKRAEQLPASIKKAMFEDALVNTLGNRYLHGHFDYESFLESVVIEMAMRNVRSEKQISKLMAMQPGPVIFMDKTKEPNP